MERKDILEKYKIDTKDLFLNESDFLKELEFINKKMDKVKKYKNHVLDNENKLYEILKLDQEITCSLENLYIYAHLHNDFNLANVKGNENFGKVLKLFNKYQTLISFLIPELLESDYSKIKSYIAQNTKLKEFEINLKEIFRTKKHVLTKDEENILANINDSFRLPSEVISKLINVDLTFGKIKDEDGNIIELTNSNYSTYIESKNRDVRKNAFQTMYKGFKGVNNTATVILAGEVRNNNQISKLRKYTSSLEASLDKYDINPKIYENLIKAVHKNLKLLYRQWDLRKKILGFDELHIYDTQVPLIEDFNKEYSFEEAQDLVQSSLLILGNEYSNVINRAFSEKWIDVYPTENKRSGGYCTCSYLAHPYIFLNYEKRFNDVSTLTHELGHAMQYYYAQKNNTFNNYSYSIFVAEVASQVNEILLTKFLLNKSNNKNEKLFLLDMSLNRFKSTVVRQTMFAEFEKLIHDLDQKGVILTTEIFNNEYYKLNKKYFGEDIYLDDEIKYEWSRIPHFFYDFYVYQYATGYVAALEIAQNIWDKKPNALENYLEFLKLGSTIDPIASLKIAGVDITNNKVYNKAFKSFDDALNEFEKIYYSKDE